MKPSQAGPPPSRLSCTPLLESGYRAYGQQLSRPANDARMSLGRARLPSANQPESGTILVSIFGEKYAENQPYVGRPSWRVPFWRGEWLPA
jgi:hypothetical protein